MIAGGAQSRGTAGELSFGPLVSECLYEAHKTLESLHRSPNSNQSQIAWLERQLSHLISQLQAMLHDIESGVPLAAGVWEQLDLVEMLEDSMAEIRNLNSLIQSLKAIGR